MPNFRLVTSVTGLTPSDIHDILSARYRSQRRGASVRFASIKTKRWEVGYPLTPQGGTVCRWFDKADSPHQSFLPFTEYQPVRMPRLSNHNGYSWRLSYERDGEDLDADLDVLYPHESRNQILAIQVYIREEIRNREETSCPFQPGGAAVGPTGRTGTSANSAEWYGASRQQTTLMSSRLSPRRTDVSATLRGYLENSYIRGQLLQIVEENYGLESLSVVVDTAELVTEIGAWAGYIDACVTTPGSSSIQGHIDFSVYVRGQPNQPMMVRVRNQETFSIGPFRGLSWSRS